MSHVDWKAVEKEYRAGQLSVRALCDRFQVSRSVLLSHAAKEGWSRDLTAAIRVAAQERLLAEDVSAAAADDAVDMAAPRQVAVALDRIIITRPTT